MVNFTIDEDVRLFQRKIFTEAAFAGKDKRLENIFASKSHNINGKEVSLDFGEKQDFYRKAAVILMSMTKRGAKNIPGNVPFTADDIIFLIKEASEHPEFVSANGTPASFAKSLRDAIMDILEIAGNYVSVKKKVDKYKGKLAYELPKTELIALVNAIKKSLESLYKDIGKRYKVKESAQNMPTEVVNETIDYIVRKRSSSKTPDSDFFKTVQKYSGNERLIWPTLAGNIINGDDWKSFFSYLDKIAKGQDRGEADKIIAKYKNKTKDMITKKLLIDRAFRKQLKLLNRAEGLGKMSGSAIHISKLQQFARQLLADNPEFKSRLAKDGIRETALDEVVGMISLLIKNGGLQVKF